MHNFPNPMLPNKFKNFAWTLTETVQKKMQPEQAFKTSKELAVIPRSYNDLFCWPGPLEKKQKDEDGKPYYWHLADSIVH